jgi:hypothetical protein
MKKFLIFFVIFLALAGTAFMFGWVQFSVPPGKYGIVNSKTHGIDPKLVRSGEFRWLWYKLIPTNVKISVFHLEQNKYPIQFNSSLPSGNNYALFAGITNADFSWNINGEISFNIDPEMLISIALKHNFTDQDGLNAFLKTAAKDIELMILRILSSSEDDNVRLEEILSGNLGTELEKEIKEKHPFIRNFSFSIQSAKYPDFILYRELRKLYEEFLATQRDYISASFIQMTGSHIETQRHFIELERYGELLTKYPILLDYLALEKRQ